MRYIITATRRNVTDSGLFLYGATVYISRKGCFTYDASKAHIWKDLGEAKKELEYWQNLHCRNYRIHIEELPLGKNAFLRSKEVAQ